MLRLKPPRRPLPNGPTPTADILHEHRGIFLILLRGKNAKCFLLSHSNPSPRMGWARPGWMVVMYHIGYERPMGEYPAIGAHRNHDKACL